MTTIPAVEEIVSCYLFDTDTPPSDLRNEALIRAAGIDGTAVEVDIDEFMSTGGGRFVGAERFRLVRMFLAGEDDKYLGSGNFLQAGRQRGQSLLLGGYMSSI